MSAYNNGYRHPLLLRNLEINHFYRAEFLEVLRFNVIQAVIYCKHGAINWGRIKTVLSTVKLYLSSRVFSTSSDKSMSGKLSMLGIELLKLDKFKAAVRNFRNALLLQPDRKQGYTNLGICLWLQGKTQAALEVFDDGFKKYPEDNVFKWYREQCQKGPPQTVIQTDSESLSIMPDNLLSDP